MDKIDLKEFSWHWAEQMYQLINDEQVYHFLDLHLDNYTKFQKWLQEIEWSERLDIAFHRIIFNKTGKLIGGIFLHNMDQQKKYAEMGTWLGKDYWGLGYNDLAKKEMLKIAFTKFNLDTILLFVDVNNLRSIHSLQKLSYVTDDFDKRYKNIKKYKEYKLVKPLHLYLVNKKDFMQEFALNEV